MTPESSEYYEHSAGTKLLDYVNVTTHYLRHYYENGRLLTLTLIVLQVNW